MPKGTPSPDPNRILLLAPTAGDALLSQSILGEAGLACHVCSDLKDMAEQLEQGAAALLLTEEVVSADDRDRLMAALAAQSPWSDVPILLLCASGAASRVSGWAMQTLGNITVLDRPVRVPTLVTALRGALRARTRQYELRDRVNALGEAQARLRDVDRRKNEFVAILAHELRNPLAPIRNVAHYLKLKRSTGPELERMVDMIERQITQMGRLIDDLLEVSRVTSGLLRLRTEATELSDVLEAAVEGTREAIETRRHALRVRLPRQPVVLRADRDRLVQVLSNVIGNAAKYTPPGGRIEVTAETKEGLLEISVADNGMGIPKEKLSEIFELFAQVDRSLERQGGLGIGLTLSRQLIELHGGTIEATSRGLGHGSEFIVRLPMEASPRPQEPIQEPVPASHPRRILVVDDNQDAAESLTLLLRAAGHEASLAMDGPAALRLAQDLRPEVVFLDIGMPRMNGYEVARRLRQQPWAKRTHLVALTGWGQEEDRRLAHEAGFDDHLVKPASAAMLSQVLSAVGVDRRRRGGANGAGDSGR